jgi:hypothetical protein
MFSHWEELATSSLKNKIDNLTLNRSKSKHVEALVEHVVKLFLCGCSIPIGKDMSIWAIHSPCALDGIALLFEVCDMAGA